MGLYIYTDQKAPITIIYALLTQCVKIAALLYRLGRTKVIVYQSQNDHRRPYDVISIAYMMYHNSMYGD